MEKFEFVVLVFLRRSGRKRSKISIFDKFSAKYNEDLIDTYLRLLIFQIKALILLLFLKFIQAK